MPVVVRLQHEASLHDLFFKISFRSHCLLHLYLILQSQGDASTSLSCMWQGDHHVGDINNNIKETLFDPSVYVTEKRAMMKVMMMTVDCLVLGGKIAKVQSLSQVKGGNILHFLIDESFPSRLMVPANICSTGLPWKFALRFWNLWGTVQSIWLLHVTRWLRKVLHGSCASTNGEFRIDLPLCHLLALIMKVVVVFCLFQACNSI